ncbi:MAG: pyruvoyl-dependent arginine decarboxylase [Candidatus Aminicenantes bacterium]|nr:MAG: pyruvoyl-dependent arginine decarboxylase [Candidatus Aminicenantes bacterium]
MKIDIVWGKSEGKTLLSAFDRALLEAGIHDLNLIPLSSIIPKNSVVEEVGKAHLSKEVGEILHVVIACFGCQKPDATISAGLGWVQTENGGLFIESAGEFDQAECEEEVRVGLTEMLETRGWNGDINIKVVSHKVEKIANVIVAAVYCDL